jgi:hypothetical protein
VIWDLLRTVAGMGLCVVGFFVLWMISGKITGTWDDDENIRGYGP